MEKSVVVTDAHPLQADVTVAVNGLGAYVCNKMVLPDVPREMTNIFNLSEVTRHFLNHELPGGTQCPLKQLSYYEMMMMAPEVFKHESPFAFYRSDTVGGWLVKDNMTPQMLAENGGDPAMRRDVALAAKREVRHRLDEDLSVMIQLGRQLEDDSSLRSALVALSLFEAEKRVGVYPKEYDVMQMARYVATDGRDWSGLTSPGRWVRLNAKEPHGMTRVWSRHTSDVAYLTTLTTKPGVVSIMRCLYRRAEVADVSWENACLLRCDLTVGKNGGVRAAHAAASGVPGLLTFRKLHQMVMATVFAAESKPAYYVNAANGSHGAPALCSEVKVLCDASIKRMRVDEQGFVVGTNQRSAIRRNLGGRRVGEIAKHDVREHERRVFRGWTADKVLDAVESGKHTSRDFGFEHETGRYYHLTTVSGHKRGSEKKPVHVVFGRMRGSFQRVIPSTLGVSALDGRQGFWIASPLDCLGMY